MRGLKRLLALIVVFTIVISSIGTINVKAYWHGLGADQEHYWGDNFYTAEKGTLKAEDIKFNVDSSDYTFNYNSIFEKFTFNWQESRTLIVGYTNKLTGDSLSCPAVSNSTITRYAYKFYNPENNKRNFDIYFWAGFDSDLKTLVQKGDIQVRTMADTFTYDKKGDIDAGYVNLITYNKSGGEIFRRSAGFGRGHGYHYNVDTGWVALNTTTDFLKEYIESRGGRDGGKNNCAEVFNVRVYLKDAVRPKIQKAEIISNHNSSTTSAGNTKQRAKVGDTLIYKVTFDEKVNITGTPQLVLNAKNNYNGLRANFVQLLEDSKTALFNYTVKDMTNDQEHSLDALAGVKGLVLNGGSIKDKAGNNIETQSNSIGSYVDIISSNTYINPALNYRSTIFTNDKLTVDDTYTLVHDTNYTDTQNGYFYPKKTSYYSGNTDTQKYTTGSMPWELKEPPAYTGSGDVYNQPIMISAKTDTEGAILRVVLNEEINKDLMDVNNNPLKLKLQVYDRNKNPLNKYVYASLAASRIMYVSNTVPSQGVNTGQTELLFRYKPSLEEFKNQGLNDEFYYLDFAGTYNGDDFVFASDIFTKQLKNVSNMDVDSTRLVLPAANNVKRTPLNIKIMIDLKGPEFISGNIDTEFKTQISKGTELAFSETNGINRVEIGLVAYKEGNKVKVKSKLPGTNAGTSIITYAYYDSVAQNYKVSLAGLTVSGDIPLNESGTDNAQLYLEYKAIDMAGNTTTNADVKNLPVKLDTTAPTVNGVSVSIDQTDNNTAHVKYDVSDKGIGEVSDELFYKIEERVSKAVPPGNAKTTVSDDQSISFTGEEGTKKTYQVWANFSDTLGNSMPNYYPSGPVDIATRSFYLSLSDTAESKVAGNHNIAVRADKIPASDYTIKLYYKWVPTGMTDSVVPYRTQVYNSGDFLSGAASINLSSREQQKEWMKLISGNEKLFNGEMRFVGYAEMLTVQNGQTVVESTQPYIGGTYYFDITGPEVEMTASGANDGYNSLYTVKINLTDDGGEYMDGVYTVSGNIGYNTGSGYNPKAEGFAPAFEVLIGNDTIPVYGYEIIDSSSYTFDLDFAKRYKNIAAKSNNTEAYIRVTATDLFGNTTVKTLGMGTDAEGNIIPIKFDIKDPEIHSLTPVYYEGKTENRDFAKYTNSTGASDGSGDLYLVRNIPDAVKGFRATVYDNVADKMYARYYSGTDIARTYFSEMVTERSFTVSASTYSSFEKTYFRGYPSYTFNMYAEDVSGNSASRNISFLEDTNAPRITLVYGMGEEDLTNAPYVNVHVKYTSDLYETNEDIKVSVSGEGASVNTSTSSINDAVIDVTKNGTITVTLTDRLGNSTSRTIEVMCFDNTVPKTELLSNDNAAASPVKYGEITFMTADDRILNTLEAAIIPQGTLPSDSKYFTSKADGLYFGKGNDITSVSLAMAGENITVPAGFKDARKYKLTYLCIPDGIYDVYTRNTDFAGNVNVSLLATIFCSSKAPEVTGITYTPSTMTGGNVAVNITTDTPTIIAEYSYSGKDYSTAGGNVAVMQEGIKRSREKGFSYVWEGQLVKLSLTETANKFNDILYKVWDEIPLSLEEQYLFKGDIFGEDDYFEPYGGFLNYLKIDTYDEPVGDMFDFLINNCLLDWGYEGFALDQLGSDPYINMDNKYFEGYGGDNGLYAFYKDIIAPLEAAGVFEELGVKYNTYESEWPYPYVMLDLYSYPSALDNFNIKTQGKTLNVDSNGAPILDGEGKPTYTYYFNDDTLTYTGEQILTALEKLQDTRKKVINAIAEKYVKHFCNSDMSEYAKEHTLTFGYRLNDTLHIVDRSGQSTAFDISIQNIYNDLPHINEDSIKLYHDVPGGRAEVKTYINDSSANMVIDNTSVSGTRFDNYFIFDIKDSKGNILTPIGSGGASTVAATVYGQTINDTVTGAVYNFVGKIMLIDGTLFDGAVVLNDSEITPVPNFPSQVMTIGTSLYKYADVILTDNDVVSFRIIDPTLLSGDKRNMAVAQQYYRVNIFDREKPTADITYTPKGNMGNMVNTEVTAALVDAKDNKSTSGSITISNDKGGADTHTFTENGTVIFTVTDEAGNQTNYNVTVDYINRSPVTMTAKFYLADGTDITGRFDYSEALDTSTDPATKTTQYTYNGAYINKPITAVIYADGTEYTQFNIDGNTAYTAEGGTAADGMVLSYINSAGTKGFINIAANKFDIKGPSLLNEVSLQKGTFDGVKKVKAGFSLQDNFTSVFNKNNLVSVHMTQRKENEVTTIMSKEAVVSEGGNQFSLLFEYNGEAKLVFCDEAGNTIDVNIIVDNLDKKVPYVLKEVRTSESKTNRDVTVMLYPSEDISYKVTSQNGLTILKDWSFGYSMNPAAYTFTQNNVVTVWLEDKEGNIYRKDIDVNYIDKEIPELTYEVIYNKALSTANAQELLDKERLTNIDATIYDIEGKLLVDYTGAATIKLSVKDTASNDVFTGAMKEPDGQVYDTIAISNKDNAVYHTVMKNGTYSFIYTDSAGNANMLQAEVKKIDILLPKAEITGNPSSWTKGSAQITITPYDTNADGSKKTDGKAYVVVNGVKQDSYTFTAEKNAEYQYILVDDSGNSTMLNVNVTRIDNEAPVIGYKGSFKDLYYRLGSFTGAEKAGFEGDMTYTDSESGVNMSTKTIIYSRYNTATKAYEVVQSIDPNISAEYTAVVSVSDYTGNRAELTRRIKILSETDIIATLNGIELLPNSQATFNQGTLELKVINAESTGDKVVYCFEKGFFNEAEMKGSSYKKAMNVGSAVSLAAQTPGMYTLLIQTEDRQSIIVYVFITGAVNE